MPLLLRTTASYMLQACNDVGCTDSASVELGDLINDAVGYLKAPNANVEDRFGRSLAVSHDAHTLVVGSAVEDGGSTNGDQGDNTVSDAGAVYVYERGEAWDQPVYLKAGVPRASAYFGVSVAISADGTVLAVGARGESSGAVGINGDEMDSSAPESGAVYIFTKTGRQWVQQAYIKASNAESGDLFGGELALSADGQVLAVGAWEEDSIGTDEQDNSADSAGAVYVFARAGTTWTQQAYLKAMNAEIGDQFGVRVALSGDGRRLAVSANREDGGEAGVEADPSDNSAEDAGAVYLFERGDDEQWSQHAYLKASAPNAQDWFGLTMSLSDDGTTIAVGAQREDSGASGIGADDDDNSVDNAGAAYVFSLANGAWSQQAYIKASNPMTQALFGRYLDLSADGNMLAVSAYTETSSGVGIDGTQTDMGLSGAGAAYFFIRSGQTWTQHAYIKAPNTDEGDRFGAAVALSGDGGTLALGADQEDGSDVGLGGDDTDNSLDNSGAVYLY